MLEIVPDDTATAGDPKACSIPPSERIRIGKGYHEVSFPRRLAGVLLIYAPVILFPVVVLITVITYLSLRVLGAKNLKSYWDFVPAKSSHRYRFSEQIVMDPPPFLPHLGWKIFWQFNCNFYCPLSVALFSYQAYLVKAVENWWCPFFHERKHAYADASLDQSYWHAKTGEEPKLHREDARNGIWNEDGSPSGPEEPTPARPSGGCGECGCC